MQPASARLVLVISLDSQAIVRDIDRVRVRVRLGVGFAVVWRACSGVVLAFLPHFCLR